MSQQGDALKSEIERTKQELKEDLSQLRTQAGGLQRRVLLGLGVAVALFVVLRVVGSARKRSGD